MLAVITDIYSVAHWQYFDCLQPSINRIIVLFRYILDIETAEEIEEYVGDLLQGTDGRRRHFIDELLIRWQRTQRLVTDNNPAHFLPKESGMGDG